ncbi:hypothetical protein K449DRAFT_463710 [Hypoxylon sp. EC38]|nr:hypothetical protein K449DRAFT_463710 [Hypoxylon sp. EC38]
MSQPLANCPPKGSNKRACSLPYKDLPDLNELKSSLCLMTSAFDWTLPEGAGDPTMHNLYLRNLDTFLHDFESHRENDTLAQFIGTDMRPEFAALPEDEILKKVAELAQIRALLINYLLGSRVSPLMHQEGFDKNGISTDSTNKDTRRAALKRDRADVAKKVISAFWGLTESGNPLPTHRHKAMGISAYENWADPVDKKLTDMYPRLKAKYGLVDWKQWGPEKKAIEALADDSGYDSKDDKKGKKLKRNKSTKNIKRAPENTASGSGTGEGSTKFTKEVSSDQHTSKRRGVISDPVDTELADADEVSEEVEKKISPKLEKVQLDDAPSPKRKGQK